MENKFTVSFIFDSTLSKVILIEKNRGYYVGCLNGVGGKIELGEESYVGALREIKEETGIQISQISKFCWLTTMIFPSGIELNVYYGVLSEGISFTQIEDELLAWMSVDEITDISDTRFAGEGNVCYFVNAALCELKR